MIITKDQIPGLREAKTIQSKIKQLGIHDVELYYDKTIMPNGLWAMCQVNKPSNSILLLRDQTIDTKPSIMYWIKTNDGHFRLPNEQDVSDVVAIVGRAQVAFFKGGDWLNDKFEEQDKKKDEAHRQKFKNTIHTIAPAMKKAIRTKNL